MAPKKRESTIDFPDWVELTTCKTHTHRLLTHTSPHGATIVNVTLPMKVRWFG